MADHEDLEVAVAAAQRRLAAAQRGVTKAQASLDAAKLKMLEAEASLASTLEAAKAATEAKSPSVLAIRARAEASAPQNIEENLRAVADAELAWRDKRNLSAITIGWPQRYSASMALPGLGVPISKQDRGLLRALSTTISRLGTGYSQLSELRPLFNRLPDAVGQQTVALAGFEANTPEAIEQLTTLGITPLVTVDANTARYDRTAIEIITGRPIS